MPKLKKSDSKSVYAPGRAEKPIERHTLLIIVKNGPGILARVTGLFSGRGYSIESLSAAETDHDKHLACVTVSCAGTPQVIDQIKAQLERLVPVIIVRDLTVDGPSVERELALIKIRCGGEMRRDALQIADIFRARVVDTTLESLIFEVTGPVSKIDSIVELMRPLGLVEVSRTGVAAMSRGPLSIHQEKT